MNRSGDGSSTCKRCGKKLETGYPFCLDCMQPGEGPVGKVRNMAGTDYHIVDVPVKNPHVEKTSE